MRIICPKCKQKKTVLNIKEDVCEDCVWDMLNYDPFPDEPVDFWYK